MAADEKGMQKWRIIGGFNVIVGSIVLMVQVATLLTLYEWVDWIGIGIWGGCFMISAGSLTIQRSPRLISMAICALLSGLALVIFYSWNLGVYNNYTYYTKPNATIATKPYCVHYGYNASLCQWRLASDIIFVVCGSIAMMINIVLSANTKAIVVIRPLVRYPVNTVNAYPMSTTNTTYVVTNSRPAAYPVATQQMVYQMPVNNGTYPTSGVVYQASPGNQQPVYYAQANPPTYTATATAAPVYYSV